MISRPLGISVLIQVRLALAGLAFTVPFCTSVVAAELTWVPRMSRDVETSVSDEVISVRTTGLDPQLVWRLSTAPSQTDHVLEFEYFSPTGARSLHGYLGPPITEQSRFEMPDLSIAEGWQSYRLDLVEEKGGALPSKTRLLRIDFGKQPDRSLQIRNVRLRERSDLEQRHADQREQRRKSKLALSNAIAEYLATEFTSDIRNVTVSDGEILIHGAVSESDRAYSAWRLREVLPHESLTDATAEFSVNLQSAGEFDVDLPRDFETRDRLYSAWRIEGSTDGATWQPLSPRRYPDVLALQAHRNAAPRPQPKNQKGLGGISPRAPLDELPELGITAITVNIVLNRFLTERPGNDHERIDVAGPEIFFDPSAFQSYDRLIDFARRHSIVVSAIILIPQSKNGDHRSPLVHPESDGGIYTMPDLTTARGSRIYSDVLQRIADRYANPDRAPGAITNWIAHNEVDFHTVWTNMGEQPRNVYIETYYRSLRIIDLAARRRNPHARVFASLTHNWHVPDDGAWRRLAPRETLESLQRYSQLEGEFAWGVAYHPYPQSLFAKDAWHDEKATPDMSSPLITIQNIDVLGQFLTSAEMLDHDGKPRPVLLSEQGYHSASYTEEDQASQAGSLWYAMKQIRDKSWIESFHYHRWIDHPSEGGLRLGLRTLPSEDQPFGDRKRSWFVYQSIGTESEADVTRDLPQPSDQVAPMPERSKTGDR